MLGWLDFLRTQATPIYVLHNCSYSNDTSFFSDSAYQSNQKTLLSFLTNEASKDNNGFANYTVGRYTVANVERQIFMKLEIF